MRTVNQQRLVQLVKDNDLVFALGPAEPEDVCICGDGGEGVENKQSQRKSSSPDRP